MTLGDVRSLLAGARDPILAGVELPDETPCRVSAALTEDRQGYFLAVEFDRHHTRPERGPIRTRKERA